MFIKSWIYLDDEYVAMTRNYFLQYTQLEIREFRDTLIQYMEYVKKLIDKRALHKREYDSRVNDRQMQTTGEKGTSNSLGNDVDADDAYIKPVYDEEAMAEDRLTRMLNNVMDTCPLPAKLSDNQITELLDQSLEYENICLKKTVAQFQKYFLRMEAYCVNLELKYQNQALKEGQHGQFSKAKSNQDKVKHDIDVIETINIEFEHKVAKLLKEYKTLKKHYKELAQLQEKGFSIAALKNELRKIKGNSVDTKFSKSSILGKPILQPHRNHLVVRQLTAFKSERPRISKPRFASQVDVINNLSKPVTTHYLPKEREHASIKPHHLIASSESRNRSKNMPKFSSNDMVHNHYLEEAKKKTQAQSRNSEPSVMLDSSNFIGIVGTGMDEQYPARILGL
nr:hypothetical protein [Tanacetum cinerariifolium]